MQNVLDLSYDQEQKRGRGHKSKTYEEVRLIIAPHQFKTMREYQAWVSDLKSRGLGGGLPLNPQTVYTNRGEWISRDHFLGITERKLNQSKYPEENRVQKQSYTGIRAIIRQILGMNREKLNA